MKEYLDSDRVNYLVWRYLLEENYREAAAKFQKEWHVEQPHRHFDFAPHVKNHALVSVLNRGLLYNALERDYVRSQVPRDAATAEATQFGVFGPVVAQPPQKEEELEDDEPEAADEVDTSRKRQIETQNSLANGSPAKRQRLLSNGYENGADAASTPMEIDQQQQQHTDNNHAYPSPLEGERVPTPIPRTDGPEQGTQVDKVDELAPETIFLRLGADESSASAFPTADETAPSRTSQNPIILHCQWNPQDPSSLAAAGTDALARVWKLASGANAEPVDSHVKDVSRPYDDLVEDDVPAESMITALAWNGEGNAIAVAVQFDNKARISIWFADGTPSHRFDVAEPPVIKLRWNPNSMSILAIAPDKKGTVVTVFSSAMANSVSYFLPEHDLHSDPLDAAWVSESEFLVCGGDLLLWLRCTEDSIALFRKFETRQDDSLTEVHFDRHSKLVATASDKGVIDLWNEAGERRSISAHIGAITALMWQPFQPAAPVDERLLASGGEDGAISIWNARLPDSKPKCSMTMDLPVVALSFTPDGAFIAGATTDRILIWKIGDHAIPRASWSRMPHPGWLSPRMNGDAEEEDTHCLCWDATGQKLAYAANSRLAVINFRH
ncbi:WD repeat protein [Pleurostoma richardsiae]|uniref:WD repeat protein n=1 Tax=Pleurostoma richardsiae TaxID=41990 RepID=A0AA38RMM4_9PEZI|nr:WD repeat protein [Pleurostoma richardsiae]